jgi:Putative DNA-binding domain
MRAPDEPSRTFAQLQQHVADALLDPSCEAALNDCVSQTETATLRERIGLYRGNLRAHTRAALASAYPTLLALMGDGAFDVLARAYDRTHPPHSGDLNLFGDALPTFIDCYDTDLDHRHYGELARVEWAVHRAHYAADAVLFTAQQWQDFGDARLLDARLAIHPACVAFALRHPVVAIWLAHQGRGAVDIAPSPPTDLDTPSYGLVVRPRWRAYVIEQSAASHAAFTALQRGSTLNDALDAAFAVDALFDFPAQWQQWIAHGVVTGPGPH